MKKSSFISSFKNFIDENIIKLDEYNNNTLTDEFFDELHHIIDGVQADYEEDLENEDFD